MSERREGWYWVKEEGCPNWVAVEHSHEQEAEWVDNSGRELYWVAEVGPRIPTPDEPWQCVPVETTSDMEDAGRGAGSSAYADYDGIRIVGAWEAMLAAAPKPEDG